MTNILIPSSPNDRARLKTMIAEMTHCMQRIDNEKKAKKEIAVDISEQFDIPIKMINKLASTMYKHNYADVQAENDDFEILYETLIEGKSIIIKDEVA